MVTARRNESRSHTLQEVEGLLSAPPDWQKMDLVAVREFVTSALSKKYLGREEAMVFNLEFDGRFPIRPVALLVNPSSLIFQMGKVASETRTRAGWTVQHWGDELDTISASGVSAAYLLGRPSVDVVETVATGLTRGYRIDTLAHANIRALEAVYRNNGLSYMGSENEPEVGLGGSIIRTPGLVHISFREKYWVGRFDEFSFEESADRPFSVAWSFTFVVHEQIPEWRYELDAFRTNREPMTPPSEVDLVRVPVGSGPPIEVDDFELFVLWQQRPPGDSGWTFEQWKQVSTGEKTAEEVEDEVGEWEDRSSATQAWGSILSAVQANPSLTMSDIVSAYDPAAGENFVEVDGERIVIGYLSDSSYAVLQQMV